MSRNTNTKIQFDINKLYQYTQNDDLVPLIRASIQDTHFNKDNFSVHNNTLWYGNDLEMFAIYTADGRKHLNYRNITQVLQMINEIKENPNKVLDQDIPDFQDSINHNEVIRAFVNQRVLALEYEKIKIKLREYEEKIQALQKEINSKDTEIMVQRTEINVFREIVDRKETQLNAVLKFIQICCDASRIYNGFVVLKISTFQMSFDNGNISSKSSEKYLIDVYSNKDMNIYIMMKCVITRNNKDCINYILDACKNISS